jgi:hypothetical protein
MGKITAGLFISLDGVVDAPINCTFRTSTTRWVPQSTQPSVAPTPSSLTQDLLELRGGVAGARDGRGRGLPIRQAAGRAPRSSHLSGSSSSAGGVGEPGRGGTPLHEGPIRRGAGPRPEGHTNFRSNLKQDRTHEQVRPACCASERVHPSAGQGAGSARASGVKGAFIPIGRVTSGFPSRLV